MRFIDYNGTGRLDSQDIATSVAVDKATEEEVSNDAKRPDNLSANAGCATLAALMVVPLLILFSAL